MPDPFMSVIWWGAHCKRSGDLYGALVRAAATVVTPIRLHVWDVM